LIAFKYEYEKRGHCPQQNLLSLVCCKIKNYLINRQIYPSFYCIKEEKKSFSYILELSQLDLSEKWNRDLTREGT